MTPAVDDQQTRAARRASQTRPGALAAGGQQFELLVEPLCEQVESAEAPGGGEPGQPDALWIEVPASEPCYLVTAPGKPPRVVSEPPVSKARVSVLETIAHEQQKYLMIIPADGMRHNGMPMPPVAVLRVGDQVRVDGQWLLHVWRRTRPYVGPPPEECIGDPCSYCRINFTPNTVVYKCPHCGTPVHCESPDSPSDKQVGPLECARLMSQCHHCESPIELRERQEYVPGR
jgi:hypothetical protein